MVPQATPMSIKDTLGGFLKHLVVFNFLGVMTLQGFTFICLEDRKIKVYKIYKEEKLWQIKIPIKS